jgi:methionine--tRNA ligase beta chain
MSLHNALDSLGSSPALFLGGHSASSFAGASPTSALAMAGITSWMSVASSLRDQGSEEVKTLIEQLNDYLSTRSFLVPSSGPTLADFDLYLAIAGKAGAALEGMVGTNVHTRRWLEQCDASVGNLLAVATKNSVSSKIPVPAVPKGLMPNARPMPVLFYGEEHETSVAPVRAGAAAAAAPSDKKDKSNKADTNKADTNEASRGLTDEQKKAAAEKRANKKAEKAAKTPKAEAQPAADEDLNISALDIRVGRIIKAWEHETAEKLYCEEVDVGEETPRKIASGLRPFYKLEEMQNRTVLVLCNLKARSLVGFPSHGMVLCASNADHTKVEFAVPPEGAKIGERITFEGIEGEPEAENKVAKKKMFEKLAPDLKTDENGVVVWKGKKSVTSAGSCKAVNGMVNAQVA